MDTRPLIAVADAAGLIGGAVARAILNDAQRRFRLRALVRQPNAPSAIALSQQAPVRPMEDRMPASVMYLRCSAETYCVPRSEWNMQPGLMSTRPRAMSIAEVTRPVRMWSAIDQPTTILVAQSITVAKYSHPCQVLM